MHMKRSVGRSQFTAWEFSQSALRTCAQCLYVQRGGEREAERVSTHRDTAGPRAHSPQSIFSLHWSLTSLFPSTPSHNLGSFPQFFLVVSAGQGKQKALIQDLATPAGRAVLAEAANLGQAREGGAHQERWSAIGNSG